MKKPTGMEVFWHVLFLSSLSRSLTFLGVGYETLGLLEAKALGANLVPLTVIYALDRSVS